MADVSPPDPTDEELRSFIRTHLRSLSGSFRDAAAIEESIELQRDLWTLLYEVEMRGGSGRTGRA